MHAENQLVLSSLILACRVSLEREETIVSCSAQRSFFVSNHAEENLLIFTKAQTMF